MNKANKSYVILDPKIIFCVLLSCLPAFGENFFLQETTASFWESNLVATVIGYTGQRTFMGIKIPEMDPSDQCPMAVWLYSIAPTNYARITFSLHTCGFDLLRAYPTNHLFVFPASVCVKQVSAEMMLSGSYNDPIIPSPRVGNYCPYRTFEKLFPITDCQVQYWEAKFKQSLEGMQKRNAEWRDTLAEPNDMKERVSLSNRVERAERTIQRQQRKIEDFGKQPQYFKERIEWLKTQGVNPEPQKTSE